MVTSRPFTYRNAWVQEIKVTVTFFIVQEHNESQTEKEEAWTKELSSRKSTTRSTMTDVLRHIIML